MGHVALDGTKVRANASKHKAMSYRRMKEKGRMRRKLFTERGREVYAKRKAVVKPVFKSSRLGACGGSCFAAWTT